MKFFTNLQYLRFIGYFPFDTTELDNDEWLLINSLLGEYRELIDNFPKVIEDVNDPRKAEDAKDSWASADFRQGLMGVVLQQFEEQKDMKASQILQLVFIGVYEKAIGAGAFDEIAHAIACDFWLMYALSILDNENFDDNCSEWCGTLEACYRKGIFPSGNLDELLKGLE